jgi:hypothetical protein
MGVEGYIEGVQFVLVSADKSFQVWGARLAIVHKLFVFDVTSVGEVMRQQQWYRMNNVVHILIGDVFWM